MQVKLWPKNEAGLKAIAAKSGRLMSVSKLANFYIAMQLTKKKVNLSIKP